MSSKYIVRQPIRDKDDWIIGYEMIYHGENQAFSSDSDAAKEYAAADAVCSMLNKNSVKALREVTNFMTFSTTLLMKKVPQLFEPGNLVIQIDDSVVIHPLSLYFTQMFAKRGYQIAVNEFEFTSRYMSLMDIIDYIRIDIRPLTEQSLRNVIEMAHGMKKQCIVTHIEDHQRYSMAMSLGADGFEGPYVTLRVKLKPRTRSFLRSNFFKLLREVCRDVPDITAVEKLIAKDPALSYNLMKLAASEYFSLRNRPSTVHQALTALGFGQLKQWVFMLCINPAEPEANEGLTEFLQLSFMRAHFFRELMRYADDIPLSAAEGYLMGLFSNLNQLIQVPVSEAIENLALPPVFSRTLADREGCCGTLLNLILSYEVADWESVGKFAQVLGISGQDVMHAYFECLQEVGDMWNKLNTAYQP